ncbi:hypothetical protein PLIIFM63780_004728 [Purpureocillium lilacinum]|nr:hypothetical protein PLIIFM63780_004728 [Purpureocillium lilacinum]
MGATGDVAFNAAAFISTLFLLEFGADKFVDHTAIVARRTRIPDSIIALLTAGAEWEEGRPSLAVGNIVGSAISNILGAFSLGLIFRRAGDDDDETQRFDRSSRMYATLLLAVTTFVAPIMHLPGLLVWRVCGAVLVAAFVVYLCSIGWAIRKGVLSAPESDSDDDDSDSDSNSDDDNDGRRLPPSSRAGVDHNGETDPLISREYGHHSPAASQRRSLGYHLLYLVFGFLAMLLAGYVLSRSAANIADALGTSEVLFGVVFLAIATTLPEKFVAVLSGHRGHLGILAANTAGSNIFLLTLCMGAVMLDTSGQFNGGNVAVPELLVLWLSTLGFTLTMWIDGRFHRWVGATMLLGYVVFMVVEFTIVRHV